MDEPLFFLLGLAVEGPFRAPTALCRACTVEFHHALQFLCFELSVVAVAGQWTLFLHAY